MLLHKPLDYCYISQPFGVDWVGNNFYQSLGLKAHNGIDFRCYNGTPCLSVFTGTVNDVWEDNYGGKQITIISADGKFEAVYAHLKEIVVKGGENVVAGQKIGLTDSTGSYCFGAHLHFGLKEIPKAYGNGYKGAIDPYPYFERGFDKLPVDRNYDKPRQWLEEWKLRFKNSWLHRQLIARGRKPLSLTDREVSALIYGHWDWHIVMDDSQFGLWSQLTKEAWKAGEKPAIQMSAG